MADHVYILCPFANKSGLYASWLDALPLPYTIVEDFVVDWQPPADASIIVTHMHYRWEDLSALRRLLTDHPAIPVLVLADGILEYRNTWQHPGLAAGSMFQPLLGHKIACIGRGQARVIESWGNVGKCEIVGMPRFDALASQQVKPPTKSENFRLLIATAQTPAFDDRQRATVLQSLKDLKQWLDAHRTIDGRSVETVWRLTAGLDEELGFAVRDPVTEGKLPPMLEVMDNVDAVITTPSTVYLESVLKGRPTAILDYHNTPAYIPPAWTISAQAHIEPVLEELADPPRPKLLFQDTTLHDNLECRSPAVDRMVDLILTMIQCGKTASEDGNPIEYPYRIISSPEKGFFPVLESFDLEQLFPNAESFRQSDLNTLQVELNAAIERLGELPKMLADRDAELAKTMELLDQSRTKRRQIFADFKDLQARFLKLKERLNKQP